MDGGGLSYLPRWKSLRSSQQDYDQLPSQQSDSKVVKESIVSHYVSGFTSVPVILKRALFFTALFLQFIDHHFRAITAVCCVCFNLCCDGVVLLLVYAAGAQSRRTGCSRKAELRFSIVWQGVFIELERCFQRQVELNSWFIKGVNSYRNFLVLSKG